MNYRTIRNKLTGEYKLEIALKDVPFEMQEFLDATWNMMVVIKVPRKAKQYEQKFVRTMYFERLEDENTVIDGVAYKVSTEATNNNFNCRSALFEIYNLFDDSTFDMRVNPEDYQGWKKDL